MLWIWFLVRRGIFFSSCLFIKRSRSMSTSRVEYFSSKTISRYLKVNPKFSVCEISSELSFLNLTSTGKEKSFSKRCLFRSSFLSVNLTLSKSKYCPSLGNLLKVSLFRNAFSSVMMKFGSCFVLVLKRF